MTASREILISKEQNKQYVRFGYGPGPIPPTRFVVETIPKQLSYTALGVLKLIDMVQIGIRNGAK